LEPHIDVITLAVSNLGRALSFYRDGLGLETTGVIGTQWPGDEVNPAGDIVMFNLRGGLVLALYPDLAKDAKVPLPPPSTGAFSLGHLVDTRGEVDSVLAQAEAAGATLTDQAHERAWGIYSGYFRDPDGHLWEVIWNPRAD